MPDKDWLLQQLREAMAALPGVEFSFTQPIEMRTSEMLTGARGDLAVKIFGPDLNELADLAGKIRAAIAGIRGAAEVFT
ncbi:efflux RND transporter permease subunit, partial [Microbacteriaceae bacterium K1510]|nr:efflux RND transporter permease subunit [Microbacteriaceae bacterium K1510]